MKKSFLGLAFIATVITLYSFSTNNSTKWRAQSFEFNNYVWCGDIRDSYEDAKKDAADRKKEKGYTTSVIGNADKKSWNLCD